MPACRLQDEHGAARAAPRLHRTRPIMIFRSIALLAFATLFAGPVAQASIRMTPGAAEEGGVRLSDPGTQPPACNGSAGGGLAAAALYGGLPWAAYPRAVEPPIAASSARVGARQAILRARQLRLLVDLRHHR
jgi:hypothetical protein